MYRVYIPKTALQAYCVALARKTGKTMVSIFTKDEIVLLGKLAMFSIYCGKFDNLYPSLGTPCGHPGWLIINQESLAHLPKSERWLE
jgi:hypothetical protein